MTVEPNEDRLADSAAGSSSLNFSLPITLREIKAESTLPLAHYQCRVWLRLTVPHAPGVARIALRVIQEGGTVRPSTVLQTD
jgi:hypothetical protein